MTRSVAPLLLDALANQQGEIILRVNTWADQAAYDSHPASPDHVWTVLSFDIFSTSASAALETANDYTLSAFTVFTIERGAVLDGTEYTVTSGLYFIRTYREDYGTIQISGSSFPYLKVELDPADGTYRAVIESFCAAIGKTAVFANPTDAWLDYQFYPDGKRLTLNKAELFENLLKQKYVILVFEERPCQLVFYTQSSQFQIVSTNLEYAPALGLFCSLQLGAAQVAVSADGMTFTPGKITTGVKNWEGVVWSAALGIFCAITYTTNAYHSIDGLNWTPASVPPVGGHLRGITWSAELSLFCAVGDNIIATSPDGDVWTNRTVPPAVVPLNPGFYSVAWSAELNLFCANAGMKIATSPDGINWTAYDSQHAALEMIWIPALHMFSSAGARLMTSTNGVDWIARYGSELNGIQYHSLVHSPALNLIVAVGYNYGTNESAVATSIDGVTWTPCAIPEIIGAWTAVKWSADLNIFCAIGIDGAARVMRSTDGLNWKTYNLTLLTYADGRTSYITRDQSEVHYAWTDENGAQHNDGDTQFPLWNLGYLESTASPPALKQDPYYKYFLQKAPVRLDITDGDQIHFVPYWSIDPSKTIDAMAYVSEHFNSTSSPAWYQEIRSIALFNKQAGQ